jgi:hypothetical protein
MKTGSKTGFLEIGARNTTGDKHFEGRGIDDGLTLLEIGGRRCENGRHSLRDKGNLQNSTTPLVIGEGPNQAREEAKPIRETNPTTNRPAVVDGLSEGEQIEDSEPLDNDPGAHGREDGFASAFVSTLSLPRPSFQRTKGSTKPRRIRPHVHLASILSPGRTPIPIHPFVLRSLPKHSTTPLTQEQTTQLLRTLTQRDVLSCRPSTTTAT